MFYSSINPQDLSIFSTGISTPYSDGAYGLFTEFLNPLTNIQNTSAIFSIESELVNGITNYSLPEKIISADYLIREKFSNFITNSNIDDWLGIAYGGDYQINGSSVPVMPNMSLFTPQPIYIKDFIVFDTKFVKITNELM
jgi:hypothetical protein